MKYGLDDSVIENIISVFEQNSKVDTAYIFGSRAKGNYRADSDIDISIKGYDLTLDDILKIQVAFEEKGIKQKIDLLDYKNIKEFDLIEHIGRVGIEMYRRRKSYILGQLVDIVNGFAFKSSGFLDSPQVGTLPVIKIKNVANGDVHLNNIQYYQYDDRLSKYVIDKDDILIALTGNHPELETQVVGIASMFKLKEKALLNQRVAKVFSKNKKLLNQDFLYYFLKDKDTHLYLASQSSGSANQANISKADIEGIPVFLPPLTEQTIIASVLLSLDDKIDLLHRQNKTLEQLAETLFRQWFLEENIKTESLGELAKVITGKGLKQNEFIENGKFPVLGANGEMGRTNNYLTEERLIFTGRVGTLGEVRISDGKAWFSDNVLIIKPNAEKYFYPIYFSLKRIDFENLNSGSTQPLVTQTSIKTVAVCLTKENILSNFYSHCESCYQKIKSNSKQIESLTEQRDNLLPKLMSGEVRVKM